VMECVVNELYDAGPELCIIDDFAAFAENFITDRDNRLIDIMIDIYNKIRSIPEGIEFIKNSSQCLISDLSSDDIINSRFGSVICTHIKRQLDYFMPVYVNAIDYLAGDDVLEKKYLPSFEYDYNFMLDLYGLLDKGVYVEIKDLLKSYDRPKLGSVRKNMQNEDTDYYKSVREDFNDKRKTLFDRYFSTDEAEIIENMIKTSELCYNIYKLLALFESKLIAEKKSRGIVDFSDLEHMTYKLFYKNGNPTPFAREQAQHYDEIYVDEYQDVNEIQDKIFIAVSNEYNRFMVGDIKQSIYGFRGASPDIFSEYRNRFPKYDKNKSAANTIFLSDNFRCDKNIIDFNNRIFGCLFTNNSGHVPYYNEDRLIYAKSDDNHKSAAVEVAVIKKNLKNRDHDDNDNDDNDDNYDNSSEAVYVVNRIRGLLQEGYRPKDITILLRSAKNNAEVFEKELEKLNLPYYNGVTRDFFENAEVLLMLCILNCIDNPTRDIYLAGALKSPVFGVSLDELVQIRAIGSGGSLYDALKEYTEKYNFTKGSYFLDKLSLYREYAEGQPVDRLIWFIYRDTAIMSLTYDKDKTGKNVRRSNLMLLYEYARRFEAGSFRGLYNFIRYLNDIIGERETLETAKISDESDDTIKIMTVHQSKGLEFPVCILCGTHKKFNKNDIIPNILIDKSLGMASKLRDDTGFARYDTPMRRAVALKITENNLDEEMRVLYVAMTRARERLIITAQDDNPQKLLNECTINARYISPYILSQSPTYIKWILTALNADSPDNFDNYNNYCKIQIIEKPDDLYDIDIYTAETGTAKTNATENDIKSVDEIYNILQERFEYRYPYMFMSEIPAKISVSELYPSVLDGEEKPANFIITDQKNRIVERPKFIETTTDSASPAER
ncbi:MAG: 3'-5' exonuclease, partial [Eubacteriales bacterium]|nr:3'-5' exonuclease [Eubacteriales bacterium]